MPKFTITTSIFYPNAAPHLGHALEWVQADFLARANRLMGHEVYFQVGTDEYGLKMVKAAGETPLIQFVDSQIPHFTGLAEALQVSADRFIRTSESDHQVMAQALWQACSADIYKKTYRAWYNVKQEEFLGSADEFPDKSVFGVDEKFIELIEEENYFFAASKYREKVLELLRSGEYRVVPAHRAQEMIKFVEEKGMQDVSISREKSRLAWGVPVPGDDSQVMYVWFDALTNYLTGCAEVVDGKIVTNEKWPVDVHSVGKDISRFHGLLWPAMLLAAGIELPKALLVHGFILRDGKVMSKSLGNGISPTEALEQSGSDALRWYFLRAMPTTEDGDFSFERLAEVYASDLANDYGNLLSRVLNMVHKYAEGKVPEVEPHHVANLEQALVSERWHEYDKAVTALDVNAALSNAQQLIVFCNRRIEELKPWTLAKDELRAEELAILLYELLEVIRHITAMIWPAMPTIAEKVATEYFTSTVKDSWQNPNWLRSWGELVPGSLVGAVPFIAFPRPDSK